MNKQLYLECSGGIAGDMVVAALLDLGADADALRAALASLPLSGYEVKISRVSKAGVAANDFDVVLDHDNHDHDMAYLYGDVPEDGHHHDHEHHHHRDHHHAHRHLKEIRDIIGASDLTDNAKSLALRVFNILAEAEGQAHGVSPEAVHFHEVGAVDAIVDIAAAAFCLDNLGFNTAYLSPLSEGQGTVRCQHGVLPVPVPAVTNIAAAHGLKLTITNRRGEWVTPTGAAIAAALDVGKALPDAFTIRKVGIGAGKRDYGDEANVLRAMIVDVPDETTSDTIVRLETTVDDATGEMLGHLLGQLFDAGARDAFFVPIYMKKNRPATMLVVITDEAHRAALEALIFAETTTIGIRRVAMDRTVLPREAGTVSTRFGDVTVKRVVLPDGSVRRYPEYDAVMALCDQASRPFPDVLAAAVAACEADD